MLKQTLFILGFSVFMFACGNKNNTTSNIELTSAETSTNDNPKVEVALKFINSYLQIQEEKRNPEELNNWIQTNDCLTDSFKKQYQTGYEDAYVDEEGEGYDADPILNSQDFPSDGFILKSIDEKENFLLLTSITWEDFELPVIVQQVNNKWLVDGCGSINIPLEKQ